MPGTTTAILGENGSGKTLLSELLAGRRSPDSGRVDFPRISSPRREIQLLSFEEQLRIMELEQRKDQTWIMHGRIDEGTTVTEFVKADSGDVVVAAPPADNVDPEVSRLLSRFGIGHLAARGLRFLSSGEWRKTILCRAIRNTPRVLILDDPYDGLDTDSRTALREFLKEPSASDSARILITGRRADIPDSTDVTVLLNHGRIVETRADPMNAQERISVSLRERIPPPGRPTETLPDTLIHMDHVSLSYGKTPILRDVSWTTRSGDIWHIIGPNGAGKSTLLSLLDGSNPKAYGQEIYLFGKRRGSGETVWDIKRRIGYVSADLHNHYPARTTVRNAVISGFHDSAGLYMEPSGLEVERADQWLDFLGFTDQANVPLRRLSYGQQRMALIARAMVKHPPVLIADEPAQGLDDEHSALVTALLDRIADGSRTCLLYVSHNPRQALKTTTHRMVLTPGASGSTVSVKTV